MNPPYRKKNFNIKHEYELRIFSKGNKKNPSLDINLIKYIYDSLTRNNLISKKNEYVFLQREHLVSANGNKLRKRIYLKSPNNLSKEHISKREVRRFFFKPKEGIRDFKYKLSHNTEKIFNEPIKAPVKSLSLRKRVEAYLDIKSIFTYFFPNIKNTKSFYMENPLISFDMVKRVPYNSTNIEKSEVNILFENTTPIYSIEIDYTTDYKIDYQRMLKTCKILANFLNQIFVDYQA